jgi:NAD(P)-dependent dehydrogenase (short-subunit alcohol dehydrogenase family)
MYLTFCVINLLTILLFNKSIKIMRLHGKVAIVTGASKGIGAATAISLASEGAKVVVNYASSAEGANKVVENIRSNGGAAIAAKADIS